MSGSLAARLADTAKAGSPRRTRAFGRVLGCGVAVLALAAAHAALAEPLRQGAASNERYQIYLDSIEGPASRSSWGSLRLSGPDDPGNEGLLRNPTASSVSQHTMSYFTPSLSGIRLGFGATPRQSAGRELGGFGPEGEAALTPRFGGMRARPQGRQFGGALAYSGGNTGVEIGAGFGDGAHPACQEAANCRNQDFWDIGISFRLGGGAVSAGYLASQPRGFRASDGETTDMFSLNAGYRLAPGVDIYGGVDWIDFSRTDAADESRGTRFMFGTNLRF